MQAIPIVSTKDLSREAWLQKRREGIGGSDAAGILGYSRYASPYGVWAEKLGYDNPDAIENEAMRQGRDFEQYVADRFVEKSGLKVRRVNYMLQHPEYPWMLANIDRRIVGQRAGLECKTSKDIHLKRYKNGEFPEEYYCQCMHYLAVTGYEKWHLAVLVYGTDLLTFEIPYDQEDIDELVKQERIFWERHVLTRTPPLADESGATATMLGVVHPTGNGACIECPSPELLQAYTDVSDQIKPLEAEKKRIANQIKQMIGDNTSTGSATHLATWKPYERCEIDLTKLARKYPDLDLQEIMTTKTQRRLTVREIDKED